MITAITIGYEHGSSRQVLLAGSELAVNEHRTALKKMPDTSAVFHRVEVWESGFGVTKYREFQKPRADEPIVPAEPSKPAPKKAKAVA